MSLEFYSSPKKGGSILKFVFYIFLLLMLFFILNFKELELRLKTSGIVTEPLPEKTNAILHKVHLKADSRIVDDANGASVVIPGLQSRLFQAAFTQKPKVAGRSPDEIHVKFDNPVQIHGLLFSVDCWKSTRLVEFAAGINATPAYSLNESGRMLFHVSFATNDTAGKIDEHIWFPEPFSLGMQDSLNIGAWIQNISTDVQAVSPEIIVYYTWDLPAVEETRKKGR